MPERHAFLHDLRVIRRKTREYLAAAMPYERIELERSDCFGTCTAYLVQLDRDGTATWEGRAYSEPGGRQSGTVGLVTFARICWYVEKLGLERLAGPYSFPVSDEQTTTIRLVEPGGKIITFEDYGRRSPIEIQTLAEMIEFVAVQNGWARRGEGEVAIEALVLSSDPAAGTVVLDKGVNDGMRIGYVFHLYLGSQYKAMAKVSEARETTSTARLISLKNAIAPGDRASTDL